MTLAENKKCFSVLPLPVTHFTNIGATLGWPGNVSCHISDVIMGFTFHLDMNSMQSLTASESRFVLSRCPEGTVPAQWTFYQGAESQKLSKAIFIAGMY